MRIQPARPPCGFNPIFSDVLGKRALEGRAQQARATFELKDPTAYWVSMQDARISMFAVFFRLILSVFDVLGPDQGPKSQSGSNGNAVSDLAASVHRRFSEEERG